MNRAALGFAGYRFRATFRHRWGGMLALVLLIGLLGGLSLGAIAGARTTESSPANFAAFTNTPDLFTLDGFYNPRIGLDSGYNAPLLRTIAHLPHVENVESQVGINVGPLGKNGRPLQASEGLGPEGSVDGLSFNEDRVIVTEGRLANPAKANEFVLDSGTARAFGYHLGETVTMGWVGNTQNVTATSEIPRSQRFRATLVGIGATDVDDLFQDQGGAGSGQIALFTPALTRRLLTCCTNDMLSALTLDGGIGSRYYAAVESELRGVLPKGLPFTFVQANDVEARADRTLRPESIALGVFGGIAGLAALLIAGQMIGRRIRLNAEELNVLRALGATPTMTLTEGLIGTTGAVLIGSLLAALVAIGLSPLAPLGPIHPLLPTQLRIDWTVVGIGVAILVVGLGTLAVAVSYRLAPQRLAGRLERDHASGVTRFATTAGLPPAAVTGIRFALEPGAGRSAVPVRSAILGAVLAVAVVVSTITFGASMSTLVSHPALYGWNWSAEIDGGGALGDIPAHPVATDLNADHLVAGWTGVYFSTLQIDNINVPVMGGSPNASVGPPLLSGHGFDGPDQVVLGATTLTQLHKRLGDTVEVRGPGATTRTLTIVGTATMPSLGVAGSSHLEMGSGALLSYTLISPGARNVFNVPQTGPNAILVRFTKGADTKAALASLQSIVHKNPQIQGDGGSVVPVERPAEILNYRTLGTTPTLLGGALAAGAIVALGLTLVTSVRRRRRDLALLKTLGFTKRQLASTIAWQASVAVGIGCIIGIPLGIASGRLLWDLFVHEISAVPDPTIPVLSIVLIGLGALVLANLVAAVPGRIASRTPTAQLLRSE